MGKCIFCNLKFRGRSDKKFCDTSCKNKYHRKIKLANEKATERIDRYLHRNRAIIIELIGKNKVKTKFDILELEKKGFKFNFMTGFHVNKEGKMLHYIYEYGWMKFSDQQVLVLKCNPYKK